MRELQFYFFDACTIVKALVVEPGSDKVAKLRKSMDTIFSSWVVLAEALNVLKRKYRRKELSDSAYSQAVHSFFQMIRTEEIKPLDLKVEDGEPFLVAFPNDIEIIRKKYPALDAADALQLAAMEKSFLRLIKDGHSVHFVTADKKLAKAVEEKGYHVIRVNA